MSNIIEELKREIPEELAAKIGYVILASKELIVDFVKKHLCKIEDEDFRTDIFYVSFILGFSSGEINADSEEYKRIKEWLNRICKEGDKNG